MATNEDRNQTQPDGAQKDPDPVGHRRREHDRRAGVVSPHPRDTRRVKRSTTILTKAEASKKIDELQERTGRGRDH